MYGLLAIPWLLPLFMLTSGQCHADDRYIVEHVDPITVDSTLTLSELIDFTLEKYPESALIPALKKEAEALQRRGDSWTAGALNAAFSYRNGWERGSAETGAAELEGTIQVPLWNWGQRSAGQQLAQNALIAGEQRGEFIKLQVAGLVRTALWDMAMQRIRVETARSIYDVSERLTNTVKRRVDLGDLPRSDLLLAQSEQLAVRSELVQAEAEQMHARKRFSTLTQTSRIPMNYQETQSDITEISPQHPALKALNAEIERKQAELDWVKSAGSGQTTVAIGANSQKDIDLNTNVETLLVEINVPFGGSAHRAPEIAAVNVQLTEAITARDQLYRNLTQALHEAEHALEVDRAELEIAQQRREIAEANLKITQLSFDAGEINLLDLLRIQHMAHTAIRQAEERNIMLRRDIALYNQVVGQLP